MPLVAKVLFACSVPSTILMTKLRFPD